ncbi:hypothetical protein PAMC26577_09010 [Caballeronia sordidicola]|uniref:Uncharacterized protein n=1 Tax=Caballeronia sordidicola TaxID=196367 RepID=A0A242N138_CABSO|nr:hypothetical protein PAMC26577_09010 [Caballeronia sordidicola]
MTGGAPDVEPSVQAPPFDTGDELDAGQPPDLTDTTAT